MATKQRSNGATSQLATFGKYGGFGGLVLFLFSSVYPRFGDLKPLLQKLDPDHAYKLIMACMILTFAMCIFGLVCWVYVKRSERQEAAVRSTLLILVAAVIFGGAMWATRDQTQVNIARSVELPPPTHESDSPVNENPPVKTLRVEGVPVPSDFRMKNTIQHSGCSCSPDRGISFPGDLSGDADKPLNFRYDGSQICQGQAFKDFDGYISWTGSQSTSMRTQNDLTYPGIAGTVKVRFSQPESYNVHAHFSLKCYDTGPANCEQSCSADGNTVVTIK